ncbi:MAG: two-component system response regulator [Deltaproteobacteria bacterium]|nr:MAG: two-component system response regulator [Deltaproteobacteria bacterium]
MPKSISGKKIFLILCGCFFAGALVIVLVAFLGRDIHGLSIDISHLWLPVGFGGLVGILFGLADIRLRSVSHRLEDSEDRFLQLYQRTPAMLHSIDGKGHLIYVSQSWLDTLGYNREEVIGKDFFDFVVSENISETRMKHFQMLRDLGEIKSNNYQLRLASGSTIEVSISEIAQHDPTGRLTESLAVLNDLTKHRVAEERIERLAYYDTLTGLPNRALMNDRILQAMAHAKRDNRQVGVFFFDLDRFKLINDTQGHAVGDLVLRSVAQRLKKFIREGDTFARMGGDEFVIVQADPNHDPNFTTMGRRILEALAQPFQIDNREFFTTASIGVAIYPIDGEDTQSLLKSADTAMYVAKSRGRNNIQFFSEEMNASARAKTDLESRLRQALSNGELQLHYQPQVNLVTGCITGVEALLRWYDTDGKLIPPGRIISVAEESSLIYPLDEWVLQTACSQAKTWQEAGLPSLRMSVNLSGHHIRQANFIDRIESILSETGIKPNTLEIELAENSIMDHVNDSIMALTDLKIRGINLAIDDFGTGYSSLLYLKHFPIHRIKIAQEFIRDIIHNPDYAAITEAILLMAKSLNLSVTAVGVEDPMQLEFLSKRGCLEVQGRIFGLAMNAEEMTEFLKNSGDSFLRIKKQGNQSELNFEGSQEIH